MVTSAPPVFSVVLSTRNRPNQLTTCLWALIAQDFPADAFEIIVVNDDSNDATPSVLSGLKTASGRAITVITNPHRQGHAASRNKGFSKARGEFIASTDDDCVAPRTWLKALHNHFIQDGSLAAVGGSVMTPSSNRYSQAEYLLNFSSWFPQGRIRFVTNIPTCNIAYRRKAITDHRFDEDSIDIGYRDSLFNYRLHSEGKKILFDPRICMTHNGVTSARAFFRKQKRFGKGFASRGHSVHGRSGKTLLQYPRLHYLHLLFVFLRCIHNRFNFYNFWSVANLLYAGERFRVRTILASKHSRTKCAP
ncbi:MAG: glycosyltransferase family 2 protein [Candidatus Omnitrophota bacterium]